ncbi:hypothetical protein Ancab_015224 [Ancistrocladus abbreviatus]
MFRLMINTYSGSRNALLDKHSMTFKLRMCRFSLSPTARRWGTPIALDSRTRNMEWFDVARILISTSISGFMATSIPININGQLFSIRVYEKLGEDWRIATSMEGFGCSKLMLRSEGEQAESSAPSLEPSISMVLGTPDELIGVPPVANDNHVGVAENSAHVQLATCNDEERELSCQRESVRGQSETRFKKLTAKPTSRNRLERPQHEEDIGSAALMVF